VAWGWAGARAWLAPEGILSHPVVEVMARVPWVAIVAFGLVDLVRDTAGLV
jgi:hypothetical protein